MLFLTAMLTCIFLQAHAQEITIRGNVTEEGTPLPGVNVILKGTSNGTVTDANGAYTLSVPSNGTLSFSYIGYVTEDVAINGRTIIDISLAPDIKSLNEVVVVGYGTQRKIETTGAIASVKAAEITQTPVVNVAQGLQARAAGVQITQNSAAPGGNISVRIRGTNSINGTSEPLYVIDGIQISNGGGVNEVSPLSSINPNDIESVEVLKDASATAIYGARGANGVILITTKRGKAGASRVTYEGYYGIQQASKQLDVLNATQYAQLENEIYANNPPYTNPASLGEGTNWQDLIMRDASIQNHQLSVTGGSDKTQLALSANYFNQDGIIINSNFKRYSIRLNLDHQINNRIKIGTSIVGSYNGSDRIPTGSESIDGPAVTGSIVGAALGAPPVLVPYREDGSIFPFGEQAGGTYRELANPLGLAAILNKTTYKRTLANIYSDFSLLEGLTYRASFNIDIENRLFDSYSPRSILSQVDLASGGGSAEKTNSNYLNLLHESILTYSKTFAAVHSLKFTGLFATQANQFNRNTIQASKFPNDVTGNEAVQLAIDRTISSDRSKDRLDSYMGRINYGFRDKYFLDLTARYDGASKFGKNHKYGFFPAVSAAWRVIEEGFMQNITLISDLKLRASYGITGNAGAIGPYQSLATVASSSGYSLNHIYANGLSPNRIPNPDLRWEKSIQTDIGLDISLLKNRLSFIVDVYNKKTNDLLFVKSLPLSSGYGTITGNFAEIQNRGIELSADARILDGAFKWSVNGNFTVNRNKLLALEGGLQEFVVNNYTVLQVGQPIGIFKTYVNNGIYQTDEPILPGSGSRTGGAKVADLNGDGQITADDQTITGNANPDFIFGLSTNMAYKNFDLNAFFSGVQGNEIYNLARYTFENPLGQRNMFAGAANRWSPTNPTNDFVSGFQGGRLPISDRFMEDGSYIRLKNITLGYTLPKIKFVYNARIYVSANNLFTITNYTGFDPEVNTFGNTNTRIGVDNGVYPLAKSYIGGVQLTF
ncbi:TonB-dependent receptor [Rhodocytophaga aerolata]|uniref:TonB-dependent receptor n=2 Tax=Rhodocytophaga aerolata TaxID=455078 RepID=A0ABT8RBL3_9BACT|nr:TonB-dependent receptor [Rhodocytophaga aerolata]MDO1449389.1 TonB-dependent receptor [Rhodocytophaga aerolata]